MGSMSYISYLCENKKEKELIEYLNKDGLTKLTGKSSKELAQGFIKAHKKIKENKNNPAYKKLNEIHENYNKSILNCYEKI